MPNKVTPFPRGPEFQAETPIGQRIICEIGADRFAIEFTITELNPERAQVIPIQKKRQRDKRPRSAKKRMPNTSPV
jgi:hypothetical protein